MSKVLVGIVAAAALPALAQWGFSESCSTEILGLGTPFLLSLPGLAFSWWARVSQGDVRWYGARK